MNTATALDRPVSGIGGVDVKHATALAHVSERKRMRAIQAVAVLEAFDAEENRDAVKAEYAARLGKSVSTLYRLYYAFKAKGVAGLVPDRKPQSSGLPAEFVAWFQAEAERHNTDSVPQARRSMLLKLRNGERIPGLGTWQDLYAARFPGVPPPVGVGREYPGNNLEMLIPPGYSQRNLLRYKSELIESTAARVGTFAASRMKDFVFTTRVGLKTGQILIFDDVWHNQNVNWMGGTKALRPIELCCIDALSAHKVAWGARPRLWNPETGTHEGVKEHEFRFLLAYTLCEACGYRPDGTILWLERGTAAIDDTLADILHSLSNKAITVRRAPLKNARQVCSIYRSVASGNPRFKSRLESHHSIAHTALSGIVGQIGRNADVRPEEVVGRDKENNLLLKIAAVLPPEMAGLVEMPYLQWDEYMECVAVAYDQLAWRTWHTLEGWEQLRHFRREFCLPPYSDWVPLDATLDMHPAAAEAINTALAQHPEFCRIRPMAPIEVWQRHKTELRLLPKCAVPLILGPKNGVVRKVPQAQQLAFESRELGAAPHIYGRDYMDECGRPCRLQVGDEYLFHINPFSPARELFVSRPDGSFMGTIARVAVPCQADHEAVMERIRQARDNWKQVAARVSGRHLNQLAAQAAALARNTAVVGAAAAAGMLPAKGATPEQEIDATVETQRDVDMGAEADAAILEMTGITN